MKISAIDNLQSWEQLKKASKEANKICCNFRKKYKLWNYPSFEVNVFFKRLGKSCVGQIDLQSINLTTGKVMMSYYEGYTQEYETINLRKFFKIKEIKNEN